MKIKDKIENCHFIDKFYLVSYLLIAIILLLYCLPVSERFLWGMIFINLLLFSLSFINDFIESAKPLWKRPIFKIIGSMIAAAVTTWVLIITYQGVNEKTGIDPSLLPFTTSIVFYFEMFTWCSIIIGLSFLVFSLFLGGPALSFFLIFSEAKKIFRLLSRGVALFCIFVLAGVFSPGNLYLEYFKQKFIRDIAVYADFNSKHQCTNTDLKNKPVLFLQKGFVIVYDQERFSTAECY